MGRTALATIGAAIAGLVVVTSLTGLSGPGPLHRYPYRDLRALAEAIDDQAGDLRTPDDCWRTLDGASGPIREIVRVDLLRSRVVVRGYASESGHIDRVTATAVDQGIDRALATDPRFSRAMIIVEPSPDGWSPLVSCSLVTRRWVTGF